MDTSVLDSLRARPVAAKSRAFKVKVPEPDKQEPVELMVEIVDKREEEQLDRRDLLRRIESKRMVREEITDDTIRLKPPIRKEKATASKAKTRKLKVPKSLGRKQSLIPDSLNEDNMILLQSNVADVRISDDTDAKIPKKGPNIYYKAPAYYQNNREKFIHFINTLFGGYQEKLQVEEANLSCDSGASDGFSELLTHQKIVRDYINLYT